MEETALVHHLKVFEPESPFAQHSSMATRRKTLLILAMLGLAGVFVFLVLREQRAPNDGLRIQVVGLTNVPGKAIQAFLRISNRTENLIICQNLGYLEPGESRMALFDIPPGAGPWRVPVLWQRRDFSWFDSWMNRLHYMVEVDIRSGHRPVDPLFPLAQVSYSPEIER